MLKRATRIALLSLACIMAGTPVVTFGAVTQLDRAAQQVGQDGADPVAADIVLPYNWDRYHDANNGRAQFILRFPSADATAAQALYIPRIGNTFVITLNDSEIARMGAAQPDAYEDYSKEPRFFPIPAGVLKTHNTLVITIGARGGRHAGLTPVTIGPVEEVRALYASAYRWRVSGSLVIIIISIVLGTLALLLWLRQRDASYLLLYGASEWLWALQVSDTLFERSLLPWPWWGVVIFSAYALAPPLICKFALMVMGLHRGRLKRLSDLHTLLPIPVVLLIMCGGLPWLWSVWKWLTFMVCLTFASVVVFHGIRHAALEKRVLAIAVLLIIVAVARDFMVITLFTKTYGNFTWARFAWVGFGIALAWIIAERMRQSSDQIAQMNQTLSERLAAREQELHTAFAHQAGAKREQAIIEERQRLMLDMHDGLGSQLVGALQVAQNPSAPRAAVVAQLQDALDHLKLTVDAMQDTEGDIGSLLGALRYRLGPRLEAAGVMLNWDVAPLPPIQSWTIQQSRHLQMILFEVFSNLVAHAGATQAYLSARHEAGIDGSVIRVTLRDNGCGFEPDAPDAPERRGLGLSNIRIRAASIGAVLHLQSSPRGTQTTLILPVDDTTPTTPTEPVVDLTGQITIQ